MVIKINMLYRFEGFEMDPTNRVLQRSGEAITLHSRTFDLLLYMVRNPRRLLFKEELMNAVWGDAAVEEGNLTQAVFLLRKALGTNQPEGSKTIVTVPARGYRFEAVVEEVPARQEVAGDQVEDSAPAEPEGAPPAVAAPQSRKWSRLHIASAGLGFAFVLAIGGWLRYDRAVPGDHHEIVLADFENDTGDFAFDKALNIALAIDLKQSPYLDVAPAAKTNHTLQLMERKPDQKLTPALAREVCQRINDQAVLSGLIARFSQKYLITLTASDCASGRDLVDTKAVAENADGVPGAVDSVAAQMRKRLGEPLKSLRRFDRPLLAKATGSLDALKAYSAAHELGIKGKYLESVPLFQRAIELDPNFAIAYGDLGTVYRNLGESDLSAAASRKAYGLRDTADERDRLYITIAWDRNVVGDLHAMIRDEETSTEMYPRDQASWTNLADALTQIGQEEAAIAPAKRGLAIDPSAAVPYIVLARAQLYAGRVDDSIATCREAIAAKADSAAIHGLLVYAGFAKRDRLMVEAQGVWAKGTSAEPSVVLDQMLVAFAEGRPRYGEELLDRVVEGYKQRGMAERATRMRLGLPRLEAELGLTESARKWLGEIASDEGDIDVLVALAEVGEDAKAESILFKGPAKDPEDTLWQYWDRPQAVAAIALAENKPLEAVEALRKSIPYDLRDTEVPAMRARALLAAGQFDSAEAEFRKIIQHPTAGVASANVALAHLGVARARAQKGDVAGSREEYQRFFALWKDAEPDVPVLRQAKSEYGKLIKSVAGSTDVRGGR